MKCNVMYDYISNMIYVYVYERYFQCVQWVI